MNKKNRKKVEVIVAATRPENWNAVKKEGIATQAENAADADYIAFFQVGRDGPSLITHIAKVKDINHKASVRAFLNRNPEIREVSQREHKGWENGVYHTEYILEKIEKLPEPIIEKSRKGTRCQVKFYTKLEQIKRAKHLSDIKTINQIEMEEKNKRNKKIKAGNRG